MKRNAFIGATFLAVLATLAVAQGWLEQRAEAQARGAVQAPRFEVDPTFPQPLPNGMYQGQSIGLWVDRTNDHVWIVHRPDVLDALEGSAQQTPPTGECCKQAPPVLEFDPSGKLLRSWGGQDGPGYQWPDSNHGLNIDNKGNVWIGGNGGQDGHILKFTQDGKFVMQIGKSNQSKGNNDTRNLHRPADAQVFPPTNELIVADGYGNHRVAVFDADSGAFKRMWGAFGNKPLDDDNCEVITPKTFSDPGPQQLSIVHALRVAKDGTVYIADREYRRVQMFTKEGKFLKQVVRTNEPFARNLALSPDEQFLYVGGGKGVYVLDRKTLDVIGSITPPGIIGPGHQIATDSKGNIYIAGTGQGMQKLTFKGMSGPATN
jgi:hypothetical protein